MKIFKRILLIGLCLTLAFTAFVGCKKSVDPVDHTEVYDPNAGIDFSTPRKHLVSNGSAHYKIVIGQNAGDAEVFAAAELSEHIRQSTSVKMETVRDNTVTYSKTSKYVSVGKTSLLNQSSIVKNYDKLNGEGFFIKTDGELIFLDGANNRGTLYSAYDFLEKFVGVRFLTEESTYIPKRSEVYVHSLDISEAPYFPFRTYSSANIQQNTYFAAKMRLSDVWAPTQEKYGGGYHNDAYQPNDHSVFDLMPPSVYGAAHPDWYSYSSQSTVDGGYAQLCLTNEEMTSEAIVNIKKWVAAKPDAKYFMVGQSDMWPFCECDTCKASDEKNGGKSGTLVIFINKLAKAVEEWQKVNCPDREIIIQTFAYQQSLAAPVKYVDSLPVPFNGDVIPNKNVMIKVAIDKACFFHKIDDKTCDLNVMPMRSITEWNSLTDRLFLWEYTINFYDFLVYFSNTGIIKNNLINYRTLGVENMFSQNSNQSKEHYQGQLKCYLFSKLMWNPYRDINALIKEFNTLHFGVDVAPYIAKVSEKMDMHYRIENFHGTVIDGAAYSDASRMPSALLLDCIGDLKQAIAEVNNSSRSEEEKASIIKRINSFLVTPQFMLLKNFDVYFLGDTQERKKLAAEFFENMDSINMKYYKESGENTTESLKQYYL